MAPQITTFCFSMENFLQGTREEMDLNDKRGEEQLSKPNDLWSDVDEEEQWPEFDVNPW